MSGGGLNSLIGFWNQQGSSSPPASRSLPSSPTVRKWQPVNTGEGRKGQGGGRSFVEGLERGRNGERRDRREGGGEDGSRPLDSQAHTSKNQPFPSSHTLSPSSTVPTSTPSLSSSPLHSPSPHILSIKTPQKVSSGFAKFSQLEAQAAKNSPKSLAPPRPYSSSLYRNSSLPPQPRPSTLAVPAPAARSGSGAKELILSWVQTRLSSYPIPINNFSSNWNDGLAFCALIHCHFPDDFDWFSLDARNRRENFTLAFDKAESLADIYPLLEVDDMVKFTKPDWKCVFTYVQSFFRKFRDDRKSPLPQPGKHQGSTQPQKRDSHQVLSTESIGKDRSAKDDGEKIVKEESEKGGEESDNIEKGKSKCTEEEKEEAERKEEKDG